MTEKIIRSTLSPQVHVYAKPTGPTLTKQEFKDECDINQILEKFQRTGAIDHFNSRQGKYEFHDGIDFHGAMNMIADAQNMFNDLPSSVRQRFENDPGQFHDFVSNPENHAEIHKMGLAVNGPAIVPQSASDALTQPPEDTQASGASPPSDP